MDEQNARKMGYLRYGVISPLLSSDDLRPIKIRFEEQAERIWTLPDGRLRQFSPDTISDWYYDYRRDGLDALINPPRKDRGTHRALSEEICRAIDEILKHYPTLKSTNIFRLLDAKNHRVNGRPSDATLYRYLRKVRPQYTAKIKERRAFEAPYAGNLYQTDIMYGPYVLGAPNNGRNRKMPTYLIAVIDDYSRLICHAQFFTLQDLMAYLTVLENAIRKRGIPDKIYCDNGKVFLSSQVQRIAAEIGCRVVHTKIRDAAAKGKIERFFKTVRMQFLEMPDVAKITALHELNRAFIAWVEQYNNQHHSALDASPMERWLKSPRQPRLLPDLPTTDDLFLLEANRVVKKDGTFALAGIRFETNYVYVGKKISVRYNPHDLTRIHVYCDGAYIGVALVLDTQANNNRVRNSGESQ